MAVVCVRKSCGKDERNMGKWVTFFAAAPREARAGTDPAVGRTARLKVTVNLTGDSLRLRVGNLFGDKPSRISSITVWNGRSQADVTFGGQPSVRLAPGSSLQSDVFFLPVKAGDTITFLMAIPENVPAPMSASGVWQVEYSPKGDFTMQPDFSPVSIPQQGPFPLGQPLPLLMDIELLTEEKAVGATACFGDSITEMRYWFDPLMEKTYEKPGQAVLNLGISGNRLLLPTGGTIADMAGQLFGESGLKRMPWDLLEKDGIDTVILALGINDVSQPGSGEVCPPVSERCTLEAFAAGVSRVTLTLHEKGIRVIPATITPFGGMPGCCKETLTLRREINAWLSRRAAAGEFDGLIDFASAVADPEDPDRRRPEYDAGAHLHPTP